MASLSSEMELDMEMAQQLDSMLSGSEDVVGVAIKLIANLNVSKYRASVFTLIAKNSRHIKYNSVRQSIAFKTIISNYPNNQWLEPYNLERTCANITAYDENDRLIRKELLMGRVKDEFQSIFDARKTFLSELGISVSIVVE